MAAVVMRVLAEARGRWRAWLALAAVIGLFGGAILVCAVGARRTQTAYDRFLVSQRAYDAATFYARFDPAFALLRHEDVAALPSVADSVRGTYFDGGGDIDGFATLDPRWGRSFNVMRILEGRRPDPGAMHEVAVPVAIADRLKAEVGGTVTIAFQRQTGDGPPEAVPIELTVTSIMSAPGEFPPGASEVPFVHLTPAFHRTYAASLESFGVGFHRLHGGSDALERFRGEVQGIAGGKVFFVLDQRSRTEVADAALRMISTAVWLLAAALAVIALLAVGQSIARQAFLESGDFPTARALGMTSRQLVAIGIARAGVIGGAAALIAVATAVAASPLTPFGIARLIEPSPGVAVDALVLGVGAVAVWLAVVGLAAYPSWRAEGAVVGRSANIARRSRVAAAAWRIGVPAPVVAGIRLALERGRGRTAVPVRSSVGGAALGVAALVMAFTFGASLNALLETPELYGVRWDLEVRVDLEGKRDPRAAAAIAQRLRDVPLVEAAVAFDLGIPLTVEGQTAAAIALAPADASMHPPITSGRVPLSATEIVLGPKTSAAVGKAIGSTVAVAVSGVPQTHPFTVVGIAAMPGFDTTAPLGAGAWIVPEALQKFVQDPPPAETIFVRIADGADLSEATSMLRAQDRVVEVRPALVPVELLNLRRVRDLPALMAALLALLAAATIGHALISIVRRRARDLAIVKALGFVRSQVRTAVAGQSSTLAVAALLVGIPAGVIVGRWLWSAVAGSLGIVAAPQTPPLAIVALIPAAVVLAVLISGLPGRAAARTRPATVLKVE